MGYQGLADTFEMFTFQIKWGEEKSINKEHVKEFGGRYVYTEQMDAKGLGRKLLLNPSGDPRRAPEKQTVGAVRTSYTMLSLQALPSSLNASAAKGGCLGRGGACGCPPAVCPPERPRPFAHYGGRYASELSWGRFGGESWDTQVVPTWFMCNST